METKRPNFFDIAIGVAVASNGRQPPEDADEAADYLTEVLNQAFANTGVRAEVQPMAYPRSCKFPILITLNGKKCRLLWYYPHLPADALSSEPADLLSDVAVRTACVPA